MEKEKKIVKDLSYFFFFLAALDVAFIIFAIVAMNKADLTTIENAKTVLVGTCVACGIDIIFNIYLGVKGLKEVKGENQGKAHITVALILLILEVISLPIVIISFTKGETSLLQLCEAILSCCVVLQYYITCKKLKAQS